MERDLAAALQRAGAVLQRRPEMGVHQDSTATARWDGGTRVISSHANGTQVESDMPAELGGSGDRITPGWLFRAGVASCTATSIAMLAATEGVPLTALEVRVDSRSDTCGLLGIADAAGGAVYAGPRDVSLHVSIAARGVEPARLRELVQTAFERSPVPSAVRHVTELQLQIDAGDGS